MARRLFTDERTAGPAALLRPAAAELDLELEAEPWLERRPDADVLRPDRLDDATERRDAVGGTTLAAPKAATVTRRIKRRHMLNAMNVRNATKAIKSLPAPGEALYCISPGNWQGYDLIPAILDLAGGPAKRVDCATLSFSRDNAVRLVELLDTGRVERLLMLCSVYLRNATPDVYQYLAAALEARGQPLVACRNHAKVLAIELASGEAYVVESSANLRSCSHIEQFAIHHDAELLAFHRDWMDELRRQAAGGKAWA